MPRRSGTDVLFPKWTRPAVFSAGRVLFFGCCFFVPVCGALLLRSVARRCSALCRVVILGLHRSPSPFVPCRRSRLVPCRCSALCRVVILGLHRSPSPFVPCRRSDLRRIVFRCLRRVALLGLRMAAAGEFCGRFGGESVRAAGLLRPFPALRRFRSGRPPAFL